MLDVVARVQQQFSLSVELERLRGLVDLIGSLQVFVRALGKFELVRVNHFVQIIDLSKGPSLSLSHKRTLFVRTKHWQSRWSDKHEGVSLLKKVLSSAHCNGLQHFY